MCPAPPRDAVGSPRASWLRTTVCRLKRLIFVRKKGKEKRSAKKESCTWSCHDQKYTVGRVLAHFRYNVFEDVQILLQQSARILFVGRSITDRDHAHRRVSGQRIIWGNGRNAFPLFRSSLHFVPPPSKRDKKKKKYLSSLVPLVPMIFGLPRNAAPWLMSSASAFANSSFTSMNTSSEASRCNVVKGVINRGKASRRAQSYYAIDPLMRSIVRIRSPRVTRIPLDFSLDRR